MQLTRSTDPKSRRARRIPLPRSRAVWAAVLGWSALNALVLAAAGDRLPFNWPSSTGRTTTDHLLEANIGLVEVLLLMALVRLLTRHRRRPDIAARAPERTQALRETLLLLAYGAAGLALGHILARSLGWHPFGFHLAGTLYGTHEQVTAAEAVTWALYNVVVYALLPLLYFRRYTAERLCLRSCDRAADAVLITTVLLVESAVQFLVLKPEILDLGGRQLLLGVPLTFTLYLVGAVLPAMIFIYAILLPRILRLTGSTPATVILCGLAYAVFHLWDAWTRFGSPGDAVLSAAFLLLTYFAPGMMKAVLTLRTGNAWVHVWAYHALAPHTLADARHVVHIFRV
ncbi:hypothetical protein GCM10009837_38860 [Streptomyces durmitorensis]|uniref:Uncharacterized protein n=1 Tax=Streptomyces durmitorensis TaxID=319947 RepID=A0ABY4Q7Q6_9ACTN|nr:hypothetical protein [Streptomyces durmitorensis]UQT61048.1 hypothetical protein M4V62_41585 [Streptomyces durmitorensis]